MITSLFISAVGLGFFQLACQEHPFPIVSPELSLSSPLTPVNLLFGLLSSATSNLSMFYRWVPSHSSGPLQRLATLTWNTLRPTPSILVTPKEKPNILISATASVPFSQWQWGWNRRMSTKECLCLFAKLILPWYCCFLQQSKDSSHVWMGMWMLVGFSILTLQ